MTPEEYIEQIVELVPTNVVTLRRGIGNDFQITTQIEGNEVYLWVDTVTVRENYVLQDFHYFRHINREVADYVMEQTGRVRVEIMVGMNDSTHVFDDEFVHNPKNDTLDKMHDELYTVFLKPRAKVDPEFTKALFDKAFMP